MKPVSFSVLTSSGLAADICLGVFRQHGQVVLNTSWDIAEYRIDPPGKPAEIVAGDALLCIEDIARLFNTTPHTVGQWITDGVHEEWRYRSTPAWPRPICLRGSPTNEDHWYSKFPTDLRFTIREVAEFLKKCANSELKHSADGDSPLRPPVNVRFTKGVTIINGIPLGPLSCADYRVAVGLPKLLTLEEFISRALAGQPFTNG